MKASDIIQGLADLIAVIQRDEQTQQVQPQAIEITTEPKTNVAEPGVDPDMQKYVPPLQAKIELLKKATGVDNVYDEQDDVDELDRMKHMAGIKHPNPVVADEAGSDEPLDI
jgi:hypothetical protein